MVTEPLKDGEQNPAYRATLLNHKWAGAKSPLTFPFQSVSGVTEPIPKIAKFPGNSWAKTVLGP